MNIKKKDLLRLHNVITSIEGTQHSVKFSYFIAKNKVAMSDEITALEEVSKVNEEFQEYENKRIRFAQQYSDKNADGSAKIQNNGYIMTTNANLFQEAVDQLGEEYKDVISKREKQLKEFEEILKQTVEFEGMKIDFKDLPENIETILMECLIIADLIIEEK